MSISVSAQTLDERLDDEKFLRGLSEYRLPEVLERYIELNPPADDAVAALYEIASTRMALGDPALRPAERLAAVEATLAARQALIDNHPDDPRVAIWLADQATDLYFSLYPIEATGLTCEFGLPSPDQLTRARRVADGVNRNADDAELLISETIINLESEEGFADDMAMQLRRLRLARDERDRRIPFLRGIGQYLDAEFNREDDAERFEQYRVAAETLEPLIDELDGYLGMRARLYAGLALARLGHETEAIEHLAAVINDADSAPADVFAARMGLILNRAESRGIPDALAELETVESQYTTPEDVFFRILIADQRFLLRRALADAAGEMDRYRLLADAFQTYIDLLATDLGIPADTTRAIVVQKLANAAGDETPLSGLPPVVTIARAEHLARHAATRGEAIGLLDQMLESPGLEEDTRAAAVFALARAHHADQNYLEAARRFDELARAHPLDAQAERSIEIAAALLVQLYEQLPHNQAIASQLERTLTLLLERFPTLPRTERWRYAMGQLHFDRGDLDAARSAFSSIPATHERAVDRGFMLVRVARAEARSETNPESRRLGMESLRSTIAEERARVEAELARGAEPQRRSTLNYYGSFFDVFEAEAMVELQRARDAVALLDRLMEQSDSLDRGLLGEAISLRIKAFQQLDDPVAARREVETLTRTHPEEVGVIVPAMIRSLVDDVESLRARRRAEEASRIAREELLPLARILDDWLRTSTISPDRASPIQLTIAEAYRLGGEPDRALRLYESVLAGQPDALDGNLGRAECLFELGQYEAAIEVFRRISATRTEARDESFWIAELRTLQILDAVGRNTQRIRPRIEFLRRMDGTFGGLRRDFDALNTKYSG